MDKILLNKRSQQIILKRLGLKYPDDIFKIGHIGSKNRNKKPIDRSRVSLYSRNFRNIRLATGRFYTPDERKARIERVKKLTLP